jgi:AcrR family transcriptional regulator
MALRLPAAERRRQLLDVALDVFAVRGFHPTSMNDVAEAAGVTKPVLYQHFRSKRQLYGELLDDVGARLLDEILKVTAEAPGPRQQVEAGFAAYFRFVANHPNAFKLLFGGGARRDEEFAAAVEHLEEQLAEAIAALIDADLDREHQRLLARGIVGLAEATGRHWMGTGMPGDAERLAAQVAELAWAGLRGIGRV